MKGNASGGTKAKAAGPLIKDASATAQNNLNVLKRTDPDVEEVLETAGHVCLYGFDVDTKQWSRKEVEGSMFVVKRRTTPRFQFIIMNRLNMENLVQDVLVDFEFELSPPYLLYRTGNEVNGLWFYQQEECDKMTFLLKKISGAFAKSESEGAVSKPPLLTPEILKQRAATDAAATAQPHAVPPLSATPAPPAHVAAPAPAPTPASSGAAAGGVMLTRASLRDAMLRLVMNDTFVDMLHAELSKSATS